MPRLKEERLQCKVSYATVNSSSVQGRGREGGRGGGGVLWALLNRSQQNIKKTELFRFEEMLFFVRLLAG